jgi:hypothetical protein
VKVFAGLETTSASGTLPAGSGLIRTIGIRKPDLRIENLPCHRGGVTRAISAKKNNKFIIG